MKNICWFNFACFLCVITFIKADFNPSRPQIIQVDTQIRAVQISNHGSSIQSTK